MKIATIDITRKTRELEWFYEILSLLRIICFTFSLSRKKEKEKKIVRTMTRNKREIELSGTNSYEDSISGTDEFY